jgi:Uma2 family endonuclease
MTRCEFPATIADVSSNNGNEEDAGMTILTSVPSTAAVIYPESDGKPMADNTKQFRWIVVLYCGLCAIFRNRADVFVASNLLWYPEEGHPETSAAPDVFVAIGRPRGDRGSYQQWLEGGIAPQVVFEILSPGNDPLEMSDKLAFYTEHGVEEYYLFDPDRNRLGVFVRKGTALRRQWGVQEWTSPILGIRFDLRGDEMLVFEPGPNGQRFRPYEDLRAELEAEQGRRLEAEQRATTAEQRAARLAQQRDAGLNPDA